MSWVEEYKSNRHEAKQRLERYEKELDGIYTGMTSENVVDRVRRRNELMILINNLRTWLGMKEKPSGQDAMNYNVTPVCRINI